MCYSHASTRTSTSRWVCLVVFWKRNPKRFANEGAGCWTSLLGQILSLLLPLQMLFRIRTAVSWKKIIKKKYAVLNMVISHSVTFWHFKAVHARIFMVDLIWKLLSYQGFNLFFSFLLDVKYDWKQWLREAIAETSLKVCFKTAQSWTCRNRGTGN